MTEEEDPFADLGASLEEPVEDEQDADEEQEPEADEPEEPETDDEPEQAEEPEVTEEDTEPEMTETTTGSTSEYSKGDWKESPAFPYSSSTQQAIYPREDVWDDFESTLRFEVERQLVDNGHGKVEKRELQDAALRVSMDHVDEIVDKVESERRS